MSPVLLGPVISVRHEGGSDWFGAAVSGALARVRVLRSGDSALSFYRRVETA